MSAPQIPNLNTLRRGGGGLRGRLPGRGRGSNAAPDATPNAGNTAGKDQIVQSTDGDASLSRLSAVELGYLDDPFARSLTPGGGTASRRFPIINRGTYVRTTAIDELVDRFLGHADDQHATKKQIISLGAGSDTRIFRICAKQPASTIVYHEIDFSVNTAAKIKTIRSTPSLQKTIHINEAALEGGESGGVTISLAGDTLHSPSYHIHPIDLRTLVAETKKQTSQESTISPTASVAHLPGIDTSLPTLLISECCLIYLSPHDADSVVDYFAKKVFPNTTPLGLVIYEPIRPDDPFGRTMVSNLAARGIQLQTLHKYSSLKAQKQRLRDHGFDTGQEVADIDFIWNRWISEGEKERVAMLEMLDEIEEWRLLAQHYCIAWGWRDSEEGHFIDWNVIEKQNSDI
ncbi:leucine carboxyl methyltransferase superfamily protein [Talaromyces proteolyticus]|uniref:Leucine carboxyl methyltransferase 1 n=1 Tax=Talaromyces proteolyticus TaxID=1131652 RepID=A0AAD4KR57_9EURO|nr:leucine carboxyl methyltransferase superfamily protein [Talaromyces proteolyticus]KAH8698599.1 leucine carboxyl methyltransferase superfamily protein [Talaromyces proteolyticus]